MRRKKKTFVGSDLKELLDRTCSGLVYVSETDKPIVPIFAEKDRWHSLDEFIRGAMEATDPLKEFPASDFLERLTMEREWHGEREQKIAERFSDLKRVLTDNLDELRMYRSGRIRIDIFILGHDADGNIAGIRTRAVET